MFYDPKTLAVNQSDLWNGSFCLECTSCIITPQLQLRNLSENVLTINLWKSLIVWFVVVVFVLKFPKMVYFNPLSIFKVQKRRASERKENMRNNIQQAPASVQMKSVPAAPNSTWTFLDIMGILPLKVFAPFLSNYPSGVILCTGIGLAILLFCGCLYWKCRTTAPLQPL